MHAARLTLYVLCFTVNNESERDLSSFIKISATKVAFTNTLSTHAPIVTDQQF